MLPGAGSTAEAVMLHRPGGVSEDCIYLPGQRVLWRWLAEEGVI